MFRATAALARGSAPNNPSSLAVPGPYRPLSPQPAVLSSFHSRSLFLFFNLQRNFFSAPGRRTFPHRPPGCGSGHCAGALRAHPLGAGPQPCPPPPSTRRQRCAAPHGPHFSPPGAFAALTSSPGYMDAMDDDTAAAVPARAAVRDPPAARVDTPMQVRVPALPAMIAPPKHLCAPRAIDKTRHSRGGGCACRALTWRGGGAARCERDGLGVQRHARPPTPRPGGAAITPRYDETCFITQPCVSAGLRGRPARGRGGRATVRGWKGLAPCHRPIVRAVCAGVRAALLVLVCQSTGNCTPVLLFVFYFSLSLVFFFFFKKKRVVSEIPCWPAGAGAAVWAGVPMVVALAPPQRSHPWR